MGDSGLHRLISIARSLAGERDVPALLAQILDAVIELAGAERGFIVLRELDDWKVAAARNMDREEIDGAREKISRTVLGKLREERRALRLADADLPSAQSLQEQKVRALCVVPLGDGGAVYLDHRKKPNAFLDVDLDVVAAFAGLAAVTLENARLNESLDRRVRAQAEELAGARARISSRNRFEKMIGRSARINETYRALEKAAASPYPVLLQGESGTGKELAARAIHNRSARRDGPFIAANCGAVPDSLLASELFGHVPGAFTGAAQARTGLLELAHGGSLFLDEVGTMTPEMQESMLRAIQEGEIRRVGSTHPVRIDVRIIAASNADLLVLVDRGEFRPDLFYRLNVIPIDLPPLRERREDIPLLAGHFLDVAAEELGTPRRKLAPGALEVLMEHPWPGNVRELENSIRRAAAMSDSDTLESRDLAFLKAAPDNKEPPEIVHMDEYIRRVLEKHGATLNLQEIADRLGISRKTLWEKKKKWGQA